MNDVMLSDESTAKFEIELVNKQVFGHSKSELQKYKEAYEDDPLFKIKPLPLGKTNSSQIEVKKQLKEEWATHVLQYFCKIQDGEKV